MEVHLVFQNMESFVVLGIFIKLDSQELNSELNKIFQLIPTIKNKPEVEINLNKIIPKNKTAFAYQGSLTTPPYTETVDWFVFQNPINVNSTNYENYLNMFPHPNARATCQNQKEVFIMYS